MRGRSAEVRRFAMIEIAGAIPADCHFLMLWRQFVMAVRSKKFEVMGNVPIFDISEWVDIKKQRIAKSGWNDNQIRYTLKKHDKHEGTYILTVYFKTKILKMMDGSKEPRIMVLQHKRDNTRILLTQSSNGYTCNHPGQAGTYNVRSSIDLPLNIKEEKISNIVEPIFHEKGISSGSIIEFKIEGNSK